MNCENFLEKALNDKTMKIVFKLLFSVDVAEVMAEAKITFDNLIKKHGLAVPSKMSLWDKLINWASEHHIPQENRDRLDEHKSFGGGY